MIELADLKIGTRVRHWTGEIVMVIHVHTDEIGTGWVTVRRPDWSIIDVRHEELDPVCLIVPQNVQIIENG